MKIHQHLLGLASALLLLAATSASADPQRASCAVSIVPGGELVSLSGTASSTDACGDARNVTCGNSLFAGESVSTSADGRAGIMVGDVLAILGPDSAAKIGVTQAGAPDIVLERGSVRVIDPREAGNPVRLAAGDASSEFLGNDAEARIEGNTATLCGWGGALEVKRGDATASERCSGAPDGVSSIQLAAGDGIGGAATCEPRPSIAVLAFLEPLPQVAAPPPGIGPPLPDVVSAPPRNPCELPNPSCTGALFGAFTVREQPPGDLPFPGGQGPFPGGGGQLP